MSHPKQGQALAMSGDVRSTNESDHKKLDRAVDELRQHATKFARLAVSEKAQIVRSLLITVENSAAEWVAAACRAKGIDASGPTSAEEWLGGPVVTLRNLRELAKSLDAIVQSGRPLLGRGVAMREGGRTAVKVFPVDGYDNVLFAGFSAEVWLQPGVDERAARERQAAFYQKRDPQGGVSLVLGAGNVASIPPMDALYKLFVDGNVCLLKMNPVNEYLGPIFERALAPLIDRNFLRIAYGGGDVGKYLVEHAGVDDVHITGSDRTHDLIVWGPPGPERERRQRENDPLLKKTITSELGNVSPVAIVPADYSDDELWFQARNVASMVTNNGSFNCNAAKVLITSAKWQQREKFVALIEKALSQAPLRKAYYPGAHDRYNLLTGGRANVRRFGSPTDEQLAWTFIPNIDASDANERLFQTEPFCGLLSETALSDGDPAAFLAGATRFMNERLWGTLNASVIIHPKHERDPQVGLSRAIAELRYGTVAVNHWPALGYGFVTPPWGGHPSATLANIQSGLGWVHNTFMLDGIEKSVVRGPLRVSPKPAWFYDNRKAHLVGPKLCSMMASPSWWKVPGVAITALGG